MLAAVHQLHHDNSSYLHVLTNDVYDYYFIKRYLRTVIFNTATVIPQPRVEEKTGVVAIDATIEHIAICTQKHGKSAITIFTQTGELLCSEPYISCKQLPIIRLVGTEIWIFGRDSFALDWTSKVRRSLTLLGPQYKFVDANHNGVLLYLDMYNHKVIIDTFGEIREIPYPNCEDYDKQEPFNRCYDHLDFAVVNDSGDVALYYSGYIHILMHGTTIWLKRMYLLSCFRDLHNITLTNDNSILVLQDPVVLVYNDEGKLVNRIWLHLYQATVVGGRIYGHDNWQLLVID